MPQLDHYSYFYQISYFSLFYICLSCLYSVYVLPKFFAILFVRINHGNNNYNAIINSPLEQFSVFVMFNFQLFEILDIYLINSVLIFVLNIIILFLVQFYIFYKGFYIFPTNSINQFLKENIYLYILKLLSVSTISNNKVSRIFFPILFTLFVILLLGNILGMLPFSYTLTSHLIITLFCSFVTFLSINLIGLMKHKLKIMSLFLPHGTPFVISPFLFLIELLSYFSRLFSLAIRLFANIMSGHTLLKILTTFLFALFCIGKFFFFINIFAILLFHVIIIMECCIALLQVYVFLTLVSIYINDVIEFH